MKTLISLLAALLFMIPSMPVDADDPHIISSVLARASCSPESGLIAYSPNKPRQFIKYECVAVRMTDFENGRTGWGIMMLDPVTKKTIGGEVGFGGTPRRSENAPEILIVDQFIEQSQSTGLQETPALGICGINGNHQEIACNVIWHNEQTDEYGVTNIIARVGKFEKQKIFREDKWH